MNMEQEGKTCPVVYLGLTGDIIHPGIVNIVHEATKLGNVIAGVLTDKAIANHKRLPIMSYDDRVKVVKSLNGITWVEKQDDWSYKENILRFHPDYLIHGDDWCTGPEKVIREECIEALATYGGTLVEIPYTKGYSSTELANIRESLGTTPDKRCGMLKRLLACKDVVRVMEAHSGLCGLIIENEKYTDPVTGEVREFDAMWASSLTDCTVKGKPDIEAVDLTTRMNELTNILECTTKPIIYDADTGGQVEHFKFTVRTLERNGISACIIEDKCGLKQNSLFGTAAKQQLADVEDFCEKIRAGKRAQVSKDFMIIARCESIIAGKGVDDALARAHAYVRAGADGIMIHSKEHNGDDIFDFMKKFRSTDKHTPIVLVPTTYNKYTCEELHAGGANIVIHANHMLRASYPAMKNVAQKILHYDNSFCVNEDCMSIKEILHLIPGTAATVKK